MQLVKYQLQARLDAPPCSNLCGREESRYRKGQWSFKSGMHYWVCNFPWQWLVNVKSKQASTEWINTVPTNYRSNVTLGGFFSKFFRSVLRCDCRWCKVSCIRRLHSHSTHILMVFQWGKCLNDEIMWNVWLWSFFPVNLQWTQSTSCQLRGTNRI